MRSDPHGGPAAGRNLIEALTKNGKHDGPAVRAPGSAIESVHTAERNGLASMKRDLLQLAAGSEADEVTVRRPERPDGAHGPFDPSRLVSIKVLNLKNPRVRAPVVGEMPTVG